MVAMAEPGPGQHQVRQGQPWRAGSGKSRTSAPLRALWTAGPRGLSSEGLHSASWGHRITPHWCHPHLGQGHPLGVAQSGCQSGLPDPDAYSGRPSRCCDPWTEKPVQRPPCPSHALPSPLCFPGEAPGVAVRPPQLAPLLCDLRVPRASSPKGGGAPRGCRGGAPVGVGTPKPNLEPGGAMQVGGTEHSPRRSPRLLPRWLGGGQRHSLGRRSVGALLVPLAP